MNKTIKIEDLKFTSDELSEVILALDEMELLNIYDYDREGSGEGICMFGLTSVDVERDDNDRFKQMSICRISEIPHHNDVYYETLLDYPEEFMMIPGVDPDRLVWHFFESDDPWLLKVWASYGVTEALYEYSEITGPYYEAAQPEHMRITQVMLSAEHDDYDITEMLNNEVREMLLEKCRDYIEDNFDSISKD